MLVPHKVVRLRRVGGGVTELGGDTGIDRVLGGNKSEWPSVFIEGRCRAQQIIAPTLRSTNKKR